MKQILQTIIRNVKSVKGNSLAEFATTTALMATLAATAAPKLSEMSEGAKAEKSRNEIDKIIKQAGQFYQDTAEDVVGGDGRGRFPNQGKFDESVGGPNGDYANRAAADNSLSSDKSNSEDHVDAINQDLALNTAGLADKENGWDRYDEAHDNVWQSVFGGKNTYASVAGVDTTTGDSITTNSGIQDAPTDNEWDALFGDEVLQSKFQDGHYVYTVVAGGGTGGKVYPPVIYVADIESAVDFNNVLEP